MALRVKCSTCGKVIRGGDDWAGMRANCPGCGAEVFFPQLQPAATVSLSDDIPLMDPLPPAPPPYSPPRTPPSRTCSSCGMEIAAAANRCPVCGKSLVAPVRTGAGSTMQLKRIGIVSCAINLAVVHFVFGLLCALLISPAVYMIGIPADSANRPPHAPGLKPLVEPGLFAVFVTMIFFPLLYSLVGLAMGAIYGAFYNVAARLVGGIKMHFETSDSGS